MGRFASAYDLVSHEYGWTDEQIGDLPLVRFRQITTAIQVRQYTEERKENSRFSWLARSLGTLIAAGYMVEGENPAIDHAANLSLDEVEAAALRDYAAAPDQPGQNQSAPAENKLGSYERIMGMGNLQR